MRKYALLTLTTLFVVGCLIGARVLMSEKPKRVRTVTVTPQTVYHTVECTGRVEAAESHEVFVPIPCVAGKVSVEVGQRVSSGDVLFDVDREATQTVLSQWTEAVTDGVGDVEAVTAPIDGIVTELSVQEGALTDHTTPCVVIAPSEEVCVAVVIREKHLRDVKVGQAVEVRGVGFARESYRGVVSAIADSAHQQYIGSVSETVVDAVVTLEDGEADRSLRVGLGATATVTVNTVTNALLIPYECIAQDDSGEEYVYVVAEDGNAYRREIHSTAEYANGALMVSGISAGERLVLAPEGLSGACVAIEEEA